VLAGFPQHLHEISQLESIWAAQALDELVGFSAVTGFLRGYRN